MDRNVSDRNPKGGLRTEKSPLPLSWRVWDIFIKSRTEKHYEYTYTCMPMVEFREYYQYILDFLSRFVKHSGITDKTV
jgi:hypothetical protein